MNKMNLSKTAFMAILALGAFVLFKTPAQADEVQDLKNQIKALQDKVNQLEKKQADVTVPQSFSAGPSMAQTPIVFSYDMWDPFEDMRMMERQMRQMMKENMVDFNPKQDIKETPDHYVVSMDLPGMEKDKINVEVKSNTLIISGDRTREVKEEQPGQIYRQERLFGHFLKTMPLPKDVKSDHIEAQYNSGVLTVKIPRDKTAVQKKDGQKITVK